MGFTGPENLGKALEGADLVVIPAGVPRKPGAPTASRTHTRTRCWPFQLDARCMQLWRYWSQQGGHHDLLWGVVPKKWLRLRDVRFRATTWKLRILVS